MQVKLTGTLGLLFKAWRTVAFGFQCVNFCVNTSFGTSGGTESFNMVDIKDKYVVNEEIQIPVLEDQLKEEQKKECEDLMEKFKRECLKSYNINRSGEVIKKFSFPSFQPLTEAQHEIKMMDAVGQTVAQAFIKSATVMGNTVHNAVVKTFAKACFQGAWVLAIYSQIRCSMFPRKCLWQQLHRLKIARQEQATVRYRLRLLLQRQWL